MLPLRLKYEPVFDIDADMGQIRQAIRRKDRREVNQRTTPFPTARAYVVTDKVKPVAIFDRLGSAFGSLIKLALAFSPNHIDNPKGYRDVEVMNVLRMAIHSPGFKRPYHVAVFVADQLCFHFSIPPDLLLVLCDRLGDLDVVDRGLWEYVFDAGAD